MISSPSALRSPSTTKWSASPSAESRRAEGADSPPEESKCLCKPAGWKGGTALVPQNFQSHLVIQWVLRGVQGRKPARPQLLQDTYAPEVRFARLHRRREEQHLIVAGEVRDSSVSGWAPTNSGDVGEQGDDRGAPPQASKGCSITNPASSRAKQPAVSLTPPDLHMRTDVCSNLQGTTDTMSSKAGGDSG